MLERLDIIAACCSVGNKSFDLSGKTAPTNVDSGEPRDAGEDDDNNEAPSVSRKSTVGFRRNSDDLSGLGPTKRGTAFLGGGGGGDGGDDDPGSDDDGEDDDGAEGHIPEPAPKVMPKAGASKL